MREELIKRKITEIDSRQLVWHLFNSLLFFHNTDQWLLLAQKVFTHRCIVWSCSWTLKYNEAILIVFSICYFILYVPVLWLGSVLYIAAYNNSFENSVYRFKKKSWSSYHRYTYRICLTLFSNCVPIRSISYHLLLYMNYVTRSVNTLFCQHAKWNSAICNFCSEHVELYHLHHMHRPCGLYHSWDVACVSIAQYTHNKRFVVELCHLNHLYGTVYMFMVTRAGLTKCQAHHVWSFCCEHESTISHIIFIYFLLRPLYLVKIYVVSVSYCIHATIYTL